MAREYPHGRMGAHDEGAIEFRYAADHRHKTVVLDFGKPVHSIAMTADECRELCRRLIAKADELEGRG